jgi:hypothetical protein
LTLLKSNLSTVVAGDFMEESAAGEAVQAIIQEHSRAV